MIADHALLWSALRFPAGTIALDLRGWGELLRLAKRARVLPRLACELANAELIEQLPVEVRPRLQAAIALAQCDERAVRWELRQLKRALRSFNGPLVLLKGAAYVAAGLPLARGRLCNDVDLLAPRQDLPAIERVLLAHGWRIGELSSLDAKYFRTWLHELPPLEHVERKTLLDIHHTILPSTDSLQVDGTKLIQVARPLPNSPFLVLSPEDMLIHSAVHLFRNGDFRRGVCDLFDIDGLARHFGQESGFWDRFISRVEEFRVESPCYFALTYVREIFDTPLPAKVGQTLLIWAPSWPQPALMDWLIDRSLLPSQLDEPETSQALAVWLLAHWPIPRLRAIFSPLFWLKRFRR